MYRKQKTTIATWSNTYFLRSQSHRHLKLRHGLPLRQGAAMQHTTAMGWAFSRCVRECVCVPCACVCTVCVCVCMCVSTHELCWCAQGYHQHPPGFASPGYNQHQAQPPQSYHQPQHMGALQPYNTQSNAGALQPYTQHPHQREPAQQGGHQQAHQGGYSQSGLQSPNADAVVMKNFWDAYNGRQGDQTS